MRRLLVSVLVALVLFVSVVTAISTNDVPLPVTSLGANDH
jgi:hypothetical protein